MSILDNNKVVEMSEARKEELITYEMLKPTAEKLSEASRDDTPFPIQYKDGTVAVQGNPMKTANVKSDYDITFRFPKERFADTEIPKNADEKYNYVYLTHTFKDRGFAPIDGDWTVMGAITDFALFYNKLRENGDVERLTKEETFSVFCKAKKDVVVAMYNIVATYLHIGDDDAPYIIPSSVVDAMNTLIDAHPEIINATDFF